MILGHSLRDWMVAGAVAHAVAVVIVNLTPTPHDNEALGTFDRALVKGYRALEMLAGIITKLAKS
jgi:hypothetical protein